MPTLEHAEHLMREGEFQQAKVILAEIISENPGDLRAICDIGIAYTETGENTKAVRALEHYMQRDRTNPYAWEAMGCALFRLGKYDKAGEYLVKAIDLLPENPSALRNLGIVQGVKGFQENSLELLQRSLELAPQDYRTLYALNFTYRDMNEPQKRLEVLEQLLERELPENIRREIELTRIYIELGWE
ncbi:MAG: hypothetical protein CSA76_03640 [Spirochaetales bacterium]|nr:MAG: hypothetical protein CSA76_03640 [Spirochaetales bacterium]